MTKPLTLLVGEIFVDFTLTKSGQENKLRLGGITHAARGFWAIDKQFSVAAVLPSYLTKLARNYFQSLGCVDFHVIGEVCGAPNVTVIIDQSEVADQGYETLLRDEKSVNLSDLDLTGYEYQDVLIFPGSYDLEGVCRRFPLTSGLHIDVAYDFPDPNILTRLPQDTKTILTSTSSPLFVSIGSSFDALKKNLSVHSKTAFIFKENRGGARMFLKDTGEIIAIPAQLASVTINSVGVGDVFASTYLGCLDSGCIEAGWRATYAAAAYAQTTYPDRFKNYVQTGLQLTLGDMQDLGGVFLPWERREEVDIYLAAPDFTYVDRDEIDKALAALKYHNFSVRRPVVENGELPPDSGYADLMSTYHKDYSLLKKCSLVFSVPIGRDPGTLVEVGIAIEAGIPVVVYDPGAENSNTMVMAGARHYSTDLDSCLNAVFMILSGCG